MWLLDPIYKAVLGGNAIQEANFFWVSLAFAILQGTFSKNICSLFILKYLLSLYFENF